MMNISIIASVLFLTALADVVFPIGFFVRGEPAFIYSGHLLATTELWLWILPVIAGAILDDQFSWWIGRIGVVADSSATDKPLPEKFFCLALVSPLEARPGLTSLHQPQPVNLIYTGAMPIEFVMQDLGWTRNRTYVQEPECLRELASLLRAGVQPETDLYIDRYSTGMAFQRDSGVMS